jgi:hypothetical protein
VKRVIRVAVKMVAIPAVVVIQGLMLVQTYLLVLWDRLNEQEDPYYPSQEMLADYKKDFANYWKTMFK